MEYLQPGVTYILHEESAPEGFLIAEDVEFTVEETGEVQKVAMKDEVPMGRLVVKKTDAEDKTPLANVEFELKIPQPPEKTEEVKTGDPTMLLLPVGIAVLAIIGIGLVLWRLRRTKR